MARFLATGEEPRDRHDRSSVEGLRRDGTEFPHRAVDRRLEPGRAARTSPRGARRLGPRATPAARCARPRSASPARSRAPPWGWRSSRPTASCCAPTARCAELTGLARTRTCSSRPRVAHPPRGPRRRRRGDRRDARRAARSGSPPSGASCAADGTVAIVRINLSLIRDVDDDAAALRRPDRGRHRAPAHGRGADALRGPLQGRWSPTCRTRSSRSSTTTCGC